jgi:RNA polymerase sigma-70 factor, ECF subfamily
MPFLHNDLLAALPRLRRYARLMVDDPRRADAMVEETLLRARQMQDGARSGSTTGVRLLSVLRSVCAGQFPRSQPNLPPPLPAAPVARSSAEAGSSENLPESSFRRTDDLLKQLYGLPIEQREVLVLVAVERMSYEDVATLLDVPVAAVLSRLMHARASLRTSVESGATPKNAR